MPDDGESLVVSPDEFEREVNRRLAERLKHENARMEDLERRVERLEDLRRVVATVIRVLRWIGGAIVALATTIYGAFELARSKGWIP